jgi:acyl-coenzyme A synthetase/AMP-(fatty) acid ligase
MNLSTIFYKALEKTPDKVAIICDDEKITYKELETKVNRFTAILSYLGIKKGDRVSFFMGNNIFTPIAYFGCYRVGATVVPSSYYSSPKELAYGSNSCGSKIYFTTKECYPKLQHIKEDAKSIKNVVVIDGEAIGDDISLSYLYEKIADSDLDFPLADLDENLPAMILYTSGSTSKPKGVTHTHKSLFANATNRVQTIEHKSSDLMFTSSYLCHAAASTINLLPMMLCGGTAIFVANNDIENCIHMIKTNRATHIALSPIQYKNILQLPNLKPEDFTSLKYATTGGDAIPVETQEKFNIFSGTPLVTSLGMTECGGYMTTPPSMLAKDGSLGKPVDGVKARLIDDKNEDVQDGDTGEIIVKSDMVMSYYFNDIQNTKKSFIDGWFKTGDLALIDKDGYYFFQGRKKNIIIRDNGNINPKEIETILLKHLKIEAAIVIGVKNELHGEDIVACLIPSDMKNHPTKIELINFLKEWIGERKIPQRFIFMPSFPSETILNKVDTKKLMEIID